MLELCAGAGHIGLAAAVLADRDLVQVEADPVAAAYAQANATRAGWAGRVDVRTRRLDEALHTAELFPVVIADPPYLRSADLARWPEDPPLAIDGGADGLHVIRACLQLASRHLDEDGRLLLQIAGSRQGEQIAALLQANALWGLACTDQRVTDAERAVVLISRIRQLPT